MKDEARSKLIHGIARDLDFAMRAEADLDSCSTVRESRDQTLVKVTAFWRAHHEPFTKNRVRRCSDDACPLCNPG